MIEGDVGEPCLKGTRHFAWRLLGAMLFAGATCVHAATPVDPAGKVMQQAIGPSPAQAFYLVEALRGLGRPSDAADLTRYMVHAFVDEASGQTHDARLTVSQATGLAQQLPQLDRAVDLRARWHDVVNAKLAIIFADSARPLPAEIEAMAPSLTELAPGLWGAMAGSQPRKLYLSAAVMNKSTVPMPVTQFRLLLRHRISAEPLKLMCEQPREKPMQLIATGQQQEVICRSIAIPDNDAGYKPAALLALVGAQPGLIEVEPRELDDATSIDRMVKALADLHHAELDQLLSTAAQAPAANPATTGGAPNAKVAKASDPKATQRWQVAIDLAKVVAAMLCYVGLARLLGNSKAALVTWLFGTLYVISVIVNGDSVFTHESPTGLALGILYLILLALPVFGAGILYLLYEMVAGDREVAKRNILDVLIRILLDTLASLIAGKRR